jgi:hypothetical protein
MLQAGERLGANVAVEPHPEQERHDFKELRTFRRWPLAPRNRMTRKVADISGGIVLKRNQGR